MESRLVTIVQYDLISSEYEKDLDQTYVYSSSKLSPLSASEFLFEPPAEENKATTATRTASWSWSQTAQATRQVLLPLQVKRTRLSGNASSDLEIIANNTAAAAPIYVASSSKFEEQDNKFSRLPLLSDGVSRDFEIIASTSAGALIYVSSSSESQDQDSEASKRPRLSDVASSDSEIMPSTAAGAPTSPRHLNRTTKIAEP